MIIKARFVGKMPKGRYYPGKVYELDFKTIKWRKPYTTERYDVITLETVKALEADRMEYETMLDFLKHWDVIAG